MTVAELTEDLNRSEHESVAEECEAFDRLLRAALRSLAHLRLTEKRWCEGLRTRSIRFDFAFDREITRHYRRWVFASRICLRQLELQEAKDCVPEAAEDFRRSLEEAEEILSSRTEDEASAMAALEDAD